jgi:drug/metabolite transporter (DMT)-like permease
MQPDLLIAIIAGLAAMFGWGFADFFAKKTVDQVGSIVSLVWAHLFGTLLLTFLFLYKSAFLGQQIMLPSDGSTWGLLLFFGALQAVVYLLAYEGFGKGQLSVLNPVFASYAGLAALVSIVVFGEKIDVRLFTALIVIFVGILLLNVDSKSLLLKRISLTHTPGLKEVGLAALFAAFWQLYWDKFLGGQDWITYTVLMYGFMTLTAFVFAKIKNIKLAVKKSGLWKFFILIGLCEVVAYLALSLGFSSTPYTSVVILLAGSFSLPTMILAHFFLNEKVAIIQRVGSIIIVAGVIILSVQ